MKYFFHPRGVGEKYERRRQVHGPTRPTAQPTIPRPFPSYILPRKATHLQGERSIHHGWQRREIDAEAPDFLAVGCRGSDQLFLAAGHVYTAFLREHDRRRVVPPFGNWDLFGAQTEQHKKPEIERAEGERTRNYNKRTRAHAEKKRTSSTQE